MSLIVIGDIHLKNKEPFLSASKKFLNWLSENYNEEDMIFLGDCFDSSSPLWEVYKVFKEFLMNRKALTYILNGNHDKSKNRGCSLSSFNLLDNVTVFEEEEECQIDILNCMLLPFKYNYREYAELEGKYDYIFSHIVPIKAQFSSEGIKFKTLHGIFIHGHTHIFKEKDYLDEYGNKHIILGVPISTRHAEDQHHQIIEINYDRNKTLEYIDVPFYFKHETVSYGEVPESKENIINVIDAPNKKLVFEKYKEYYIREAGIKLLRTENTQGTFKQEFESANILQKFQKYSADKNLSKEVSEECSTRLSQII